MVTVYGDDLYLFRYDTTKDVDVNRFRNSDYTYAHTMYHFSDGARLENSSGGLDKLVLCGPVNGDDHFYIVDLSGDDWKEQAKTIDGRGVLGDVRNTLETLKTDVENFSGTVAEGEPIRYLYRYGFLGWDMTSSAEIETQANLRLSEIQKWKDELGGNPQKVKFYVDLKSSIIGNAARDNQTPEGMVKYVKALAERGIYSCLNIGHGPSVSVSPETLADCYEASIIGGEVFMMARTQELVSISDYNAYLPHFEALLQRSQTLSATPPWVMMLAKGAYLTALSDSQGNDFFDKYKDMFVAGVEESNVRMPEWVLSERVGLWLNRDIKAWSGEMIGDNITPNRVAEWSDMRNAHVVLRAMLTRYSLGASVFRNTVIYPTNFLFDRGDITDIEYQYSNPWRQGILTFLKMVEYGVLPSAPDQDQIKGVSPVGIAISNVDSHFLKITDKHNWNNFVYDSQTNVVNNLSCWDGYVNTSENDATSYLFNTKRRFDNLIPTSPGGFVAILPQTTKSEMLENPRWESAFQTDTSIWSDGMGLSTAKSTISAELVNKVTNLPFYVENECFWQFIEQKNNPDVYFAILIDPNVLTPTSRTVKLKKGSANESWEVFDQFGSQSSPLGTLTIEADEVSINIPAGSVRVLTLKKKEVLNVENENTSLYKIYPNPAKYSMSIELPINFEDYEMAIYDVTGRLVKIEEIQNKMNTVSLNSIVSGIYFVRLKNQSGNIKVVKLVKE